VHAGARTNAPVAQEVERVDLTADHEAAHAAVRHEAVRADTQPEVRHARLARRGHGMRELVLGPCPLQQVLRPAAPGRRGRRDQPIPPQPLLRNPTPQRRDEIRTRSTPPCTPTHTPPNRKGRAPRRDTPLHCAVGTCYFRWLLTSLVISNIETRLLPPNTRRSLSSALIIRRSLASWRLFFLMYAQIFFVTSVRGCGVLPTIAARSASGCMAFMNAGFGARFAPDRFRVAFFAVLRVAFFAPLRAAVFF